jgi:hypothetical protein
MNNRLYLSVKARRALRFFINILCVLKNFSEAGGSVLFHVIPAECRIIGQFGQGIGAPFGVRVDRDAVA